MLSSGVDGCRSLQWRHEFGQSVRVTEQPAKAPVIIISGPSGSGKTTASRMVAADFDRSVHIGVDDVMASIVGGWIDPSLPEAATQNFAVGAAVAVAAMSWAEHGYAAVVDGTLFTEGATGLAAACDARDIACRFVVLGADLATCWARATRRAPGRWPVNYESFVALHSRFEATDPARVIDAHQPPDSVAVAVVSAVRDGRLSLRAEGDVH